MYTLIRQTLKLGAINAGFIIIFLIVNLDSRTNNTQNLLISSDPLQKGDNLIAFKLLMYQFLELERKTENYCLSICTFTFPTLYKVLKFNQLACQ